MYRALYTKLLEWQSSRYRKPLILEGARQVGKTWLLREFGRNEYRNVAYLNCQNNPDAESLFLDYDIDRILRNISAICDCSITDDTLIILDEIQEVKNGLSSLKYFYEERPNIHVAVAGSLLGLSHMRGESFPVGKVDFLRLYPMTFNEFLAALGKEHILNILTSNDWKIQVALEKTLVELLRQYYFVGGMPEVVLKYVETKDIHEVRKTQSAILSAYDRDFAKHAGNEVQRIRQVWSNIPKQLAKENKKFIFGSVRKGARASDFDEALQWLKDAALIYRIERCTRPEIPLSFYADPNAFKVYILDVGLLGAMAEIPAKQMLIKDSVFSEYKGAFTENYVIQQLTATIKAKYYYFSKDNSTQEVDFIFQRDDKIIPVEVKAEENVKSKSLSTFVNVDHADKNFKAIRFSMLQYKDQGWMENIPLWSVASLNTSEVEPNG